MKDRSEVRNLPSLRNHFMQLPRETGEKEKGKSIYIVLLIVSVDKKEYPESLRVLWLGIRFNPAAYIVCPSYFGRLGYTHISSRSNFPP